MKIVIVGYGEMLRALISGVLKTKHEIVGVFREENIKYPPLTRFIYDVLQPTDDYNFIRTHQLKEIKAKSVNSQEFINSIKKLKTDVILVGSWSEKFSLQTINTPKIACINTHPSLLPKYRGPNPYLQVILNNEQKTGVTFHLMEVNYDTGAILHQAETEILKTDTGESLKYRCCDLARNEIINLLNNLPQKLKEQKSQNEQESTYQHQISLAESILDFEKETSLEIDKRIRALTPWLKCHIPYKNDFFTFESYKIYQKKSKKRPSSIVKKTNNSLFIVCKDGYVIEFCAIKIKRPFSAFFTKLYLEKIIKTNEQAI